MHGGVAMWSLASCTFCMLVSLQAGWGSAWAAADGLEAEVKIEVLFKPFQCAQKSKKGDLMNIHYDGFLAKDGSQFYCSRTDKSGHPQWVVLGIGQIIKGLDVGMTDMCAGERRKITVPPALAFGEKGKGPVPPNATVIFEVEAFSVSRGPRSMEAFGNMDLDNDKSLTKDEIKEYLKMEYKKDGKPREEKFFDKYVEDIFRENDGDKNGRISVKEYNIYKHDEL